MWKKFIEWLKKMFEKDDEPDQPNEDLDISKINWLGSNYSGATMQKFINSASMNSRHLSTNYNSYSWPSQDVGGVTCDAIFCLFYEKGDKIVGGKFDWARKNGQSVKTLENVHHGYQGHTFPEPGKKAWMCLVSVDGSKRSNIISVSR